MNNALILILLLLPILIQLAVVYRWFKVFIAAHAGLLWVLIFTPFLTLVGWQVYYFISYALLGEVVSGGLVTYVFNIIISVLFIIPLYGVDCLFKILQEYKELNLTIDSIPDMIMILDNELNVLKANKSVYSYTGLSPKEVIGRKCHDVMHHTGKPPKNCPFLNMSPDGRTSPIEVEEFGRQYLVQVLPLQSQKGMRAGCIHLARDITDYKEVQRELNSKKADLAKIELGKTRDLLESAKTLNAGVAHELRTPMQSILNSLELLEMMIESGCRFKDTASCDEAIGLIHDAVARLEYSVFVLNSLSAYVKTGNSAEIHTINVKDEVEMTIRTLKFTDRFKQLSNDQLKVVLPEFSPYIKINQSAFIQILSNLCKNAIEAINHPDPRISVVVTTDRDNVIIKVADNGIGIDPSLGNQIFEPYFSTKDHEDDLNQGLGLAIVKSNVLAFNGTINYTSIPSRTEFTVVFPKARAELIK